MNTNTMNEIKRRKVTMKMYKKFSFSQNFHYSCEKKVTLQYNEINRRKVY